VENDGEEKSDALIRFIDTLGYKMYWHNPPLFNPNNFASNREIIFGQTVSVKVLCLPKKSLQEIRGLRGRASAGRGLARPRQTRGA
jgi:hypothetical protein